MESRRVYPRRGGIYRFIQIYNVGVPEIILFNGDYSDNIEKDCVDFFGDDFSVDKDWEILMIGGGEIAINFNKENHSVSYSMWNKTPRRDFKIDKKHLEDYLKIKKINIELR